MQTSRLKKQAASLQALRDTAAPSGQAVCTDSDSDSDIEDPKVSSSEAEVDSSDSSDEADALVDSDDDEPRRFPMEPSTEPSRERVREERREPPKEKSRDGSSDALATTLPVATKKRKRLRDGTEDGKQGRVRLQGLKSIQRDRLKQLSRKSQSQSQTLSQSHREENLTDKLSEEVQAAGDRARAKDLATSKTAHELPPPQPSKQGTGLKPDYLLVQQRNKDERMAHQKHHLPIPVRALGVDRHNPRSHIH